MPTINQLSSTSTLAGGDLLPVFDQSEGDARKVSISTLLAYIAANFAEPGLDKQTAAPTSSGFTVTVTPSTESRIWLVLSPTGSFADGTIELPDNADTFDGQSVLVTSSQAIVALTINSTGGVNGAPTSLSSAGFFEVRYNATVGEWFCVAQSLGSIATITDLTLGGVILNPEGETMLSFAQEGVGAAVNYPAVFYSTTGNEVGIAAVGADTNIDVSLVPKGSGVVRANGIEVVGTTGVQQLLDKTIIDGALQNCTASDGVLTWATTTVGALGSAATKGQRKFVTDSNAAMTAGIGAIVAGGGANNVPVFSDGTNWRIG